ncbi:12760_t:CDS:2, partial [Acaulospora colombiana]
PLPVPPNSAVSTPSRDPGLFGEYIYYYTMPNNEGTPADDLPEDQAQALPCISTLKLKLNSNYSENRSITGSEGLRRIRFEQSAVGSSTDGLSYSHSTCYSCNSKSERMSDLEGDNHQRDSTSLLSYNSTRDIKQFVKEVNGREKQSVALVIAMGGLYPCPDVIEAILDPTDGLSKYILDIGQSKDPSIILSRLICIQDVELVPAVLGVDVAPPPMDTGVLPPNLQFEIDDINLGLSHFYDQYDVVHVRCVSGGIKDMDRTIVEYQKCLKPGGVLLIIEGDYNIHETKEKPARLKRLPGDPDVSGVCDNGSWLRRMVLEACVACGIAGSCVHRSSELIDLGLWDYPLMDPETARAGGLYLPIGPWAKGDDLPAPSLPKRSGRSSPLETPPLTPIRLSSPPISPELKDFCRPPGHRYPAIEIFTTAEEARKAREKRQLNVGELPEMMVERNWRLMQQQIHQPLSTDATSVTSP